MTRDPQSIQPDKAFGHAMLMMYEGGFRHVPVVEKGHPLGVVSTRDALGPELQEFESQLSNREHIREILG
jgi:signal-transduction protein with cAMP-binding, CBS, and nucleotidyltransferase domain